MDTKLTQKHLLRVEMSSDNDSFTKKVADTDEDDVPELYEMCSECNAKMEISKGDLIIEEVQNLNTDGTQTNVEDEQSISIKVELRPPLDRVEELSTKIADDLNCIPVVNANIYPSIINVTSADVVSKIHFSAQGDLLPGKIHDNVRACNNDFQRNVRIVTSQAICSPCNKEQATLFCDTCEENMCESCSQVHRNSKATRSHIMCSLVLETVTFACEPCEAIGKKFQAVFICQECNEMYCSECAEVHTKQKATKKHNLSSHGNVLRKQVCEPCQGNEKKSIMTALCIECDEGLCLKCAYVHMSLKATRNHSVIRLLKPPSNNRCEQCSGNVQDTIVCYCKMCMTYMCAGCRQSHRQADLTKHHNIENVGCQDAHAERTLMNLCLNEISDTKTDCGKIWQLEKETGNQQKSDLMKPQKPFVNDVQVDSLYLSWMEPKEKLLPMKYQIRYKETTDGSIWEFCSKTSTICTHEIQNLKSNALYVFQVRMVNNDIEGPYSDISEPVQTLMSAAGRLFDFTYMVSKPDVDIQLRQVPLREHKCTINLQAMTRKLEFGDDFRQNVRERTILLVGVTGSGKSTLVDGMINYVLGVKWNDTYRLTTLNLEEQELKQEENQAMSQTQWVTCYTINHIHGSRISYKLNVIDTPGFGDTRGIEKDNQVIDQIRQLFSASDQKGVLFIDAVCFLVKAPDARLTQTQKYIFESIMSMFGQDIKDNFCMLVTFADGMRPPVLAALKEANLPHEIYFPFNNSALFADNGGVNVSSLSQTFWDMGLNSFSDFFKKLDTMETKSLQQTKEVLNKRRVIEITIENLLLKVDAGLSKLEELRQEIHHLEIHRTDTEANKDFTYTVIETQHIKIDLPKGKHVTNCLHCHITCHKNCTIPNDEDKYKCCAMKDGNCTQCTDKCHWKQHKNTPYIFEYINVPKTHTYAEKEEKYRKASGEKITKETVISRMQEELDDLRSEIFEFMDEIRNCNNTLKEIALRPDPLSIAEYIDLLIESEKIEKRPGYPKRIASLEIYKKKASYSRHVEKFHSNLTDTRQQTQYVSKQPRVKKSKSKFSWLKVFQ